MFTRKETKAFDNSPPNSTSPIRKLRRLLSPKKRLEPTGWSDLEKVFHCLDEDKDGKISPKELRRCVRAAGQEMSEEEAEAAVAENDADGDGLLGVEEFARMVEVGEEKSGRDLRDAFGMYEMEGSGCITPKSLKRMMDRLGEKSSIEQCKAMIGRFDLDGDGVLSFEEFSFKEFRCKRDYKAYVS